MHTNFFSKNIANFFGFRQTGVWVPPNRDGCCKNPHESKQLIFSGLQDLPKKILQKSYQIMSV
jgi:hypothetical protein